MSGQSDVPQSGGICATSAAPPLHQAPVMLGPDTRRCGANENRTKRTTDCDAGRELSAHTSDLAGFAASSPELRRLRLEIGRLVEGHLRILRLLGRGGMSEVY